MTLCKQFSFKIVFLIFAVCDLVFFIATGLTVGGDFIPKENCLTFAGGDLGDSITGDTFFLLNLENPDGKRDGDTCFVTVLGGAVFDELDIYVTPDVEEDG